MIISSRKIEIRNANINDVPALCEAFVKTYATVDNDLEAFFTDIIKDANAINRVMVSNNTISGFITAEKNTKISARMDIFVAPEFQRAGIGTFLFNDMKSQLRQQGLTYMSWLANPKNEKAISFYSKMGAGQGSKFGDQLLYKIGL
jgi:ribosomal protein S18 acetylase RimI-like enzyme